SVRNAPELDRRGTEDARVETDRLVNVRYIQTNMMKMGPLLGHAVGGQAGASKPQQNGNGKKTTSHCEAPGGGWRARHFLATGDLFSSTRLGYLGQAHSNAAG